jgi:hypothetical protein
VIGEDLGSEILRIGVSGHQAEIEGWLEGRQDSKIRTPEAVPLLHVCQVAAVDLGAPLKKIRIAAHRPALAHH